MQVTGGDGTLNVYTISGYGTTCSLPSLVSSAASTFFATDVTFTVTLPTADTGQVYFVDGCTSIGSGTLVNGTATLTISTLAVGDHQITAMYMGDQYNLPSVSPSVTQTVLPASSTISLTSSSVSSEFGATLTLTASQNDLATGTDSFYIDGNFAGTAPLIGGIATLSTDTLAVGTYEVTVTCIGDVNFDAATSSTLTQTITRATTIITMGSTADPSIVGQPFALTASVSSPNPGTVAPTGSVTFMEGNTVVTSTTGWAPGTYVLTAVYSGDSNFLSSISAPFTQVITSPNTTKIVSSSIDGQVFSPCRPM